MNYNYAPHTNSLAIVALCLGLGGFVFGIIAAIPAVIIGNMAHRQISQTGEEGQGLATAGIILGWVGIIWTVILFVIILVLIGSAGAASTNTYP